MKKIILYISSFALIMSFLVPVGVMAQEDESEPGYLIVCGQTTNNPCGFDDLILLAGNIVKFLIYLSIPVSAILFIWAGFLYLTAGADVGKAQKAKGIFINVSIGLAIIIYAWLIVYTIVAGLTDDPRFLRFLR